MGDVSNLSLRDLAQAYNGWQDGSKHLDVNLIPQAFDFKSIKFKFAPRDGQINIDGMVIDFTKGISFSTDFTFLGVDECKVRIEQWDLFDFAGGNPHFFKIVFVTM
jgi:hypothetical protein